MRIFLLFIILALALPISGHAQAGFTLSGQVRCAGGAPLAQVTVTLVLDSGTQMDSLQTDANGMFSFPGVPAAGNYRLQAALKPTPEQVRSISISDAAAATHHVLGIRQLPETSVAAMDINNNSLLTTLDIVLFRRYLLRFPDNTFQPAWLFQHKGGYGEQRIENLASDLTDLSWTAILRGDGNGSGCPE